MADKPTIYLLSDFGSSDQYVAVMKAVIVSRCPEARLIDITHHVEPFAIEAGAYILESTWTWLPPGSIVMAVVDPGVGTDREPAVFFHDDKWVIGPNNGLLSFLPAELKGRKLDNEDMWLKPVSSTFHGRDIFAPCAAYIAAGNAWEQLGKEPAHPERPEPVPRLEPHDKAYGYIIHFDHFGTAITNIRMDEIGPVSEVRYTERLTLPVSNTFSDVPVGEAVAYKGSTGRLEIAVNRGSAKEELNLQIGDYIYLY